MRTLQSESPHFGAIHEHMAASGMPEGLRRLEWDGVTPGPHVDFARRWAAGDECGMLLEGPVGVGKTGLAAVAAVAFMARRSLRWTSAPLLQAQLASGFGTALRGMAEEVTTRTDALVIDDIDKIREDDVVMARALFMAIDGRRNAGTSLLITTNLDPDELYRLFPGKYGEMITSRIFGHCARFKITGTDRRMG